MMRRFRPLFLLAIVVIAGYLLKTYQKRIAAIIKESPRAPTPLPQGISATYDGWHWEKNGEHGPAVDIRAKGFRQIQEPSRFELDKVELKIYHKDGKAFDKILSDKAIFDTAEAYLYSEGEADITMGMAEGQEPSPNRIIHIKSSGVRFDSKTGKAETEREATFSTDRGQGKAVGAIYDPTTHELRLKSHAELIWRDPDPESDSPPMKVEAGEVVYKENESKVFLSPWAKLTRTTMTLEGKGAVITLDKNAIRLVETTEAKGVDQKPGKLLEYSASELKMTLTEKSQVEKIEAKGNAKLVTTSDQAVTTTTGDRVDLDFQIEDNESVLKRVLASGKTVVESKPQLRPNTLLGDTKILRSEIVELKMRAGGHEIETMDTQSPGVLEFLPNRPGQHKRRVDGERFHVEYGAQNQVDKFQVTQASTRTENDPKQGKPQPPSLTWSRELTALFAPKSGEMTRMEQVGDFRYEDGDRKARSERALLDQTSGRITLLQNARVSDATGATTADTILLDQKTGDFRADGNVSSSRLPDKKGAGSAMLGKEEPLQAKATKMTTTDRQALVVYEGNAILWQAASRLQADRIEIDRKNSQLRANGKVVSQLQDQGKQESPKKSGQAPPVYTLITAPAMIYYDKERLAHYTGGAFLRRDELDVKAKEIRAFLTPEDKTEQKPPEKSPAKPPDKPPDKQLEKKDGNAAKGPADKSPPDKPKDEEGTSLDHALADGNVVIVRVTKDRTRKGVSEHADYIVKESKIVMEQGEPVFEDSLKGTTRGQQLIYYSDDDRLLVNGVPEKPAASRLRRK